MTESRSGVTDNKGTQGNFRGGGYKDTHTLIKLTTRTCGTGVTGKLHINKLIFKELKLKIKARFYKRSPRRTLSKLSLSCFGKC